MICMYGAPCGVIEAWLLGKDVAECRVPTEGCLWDACIGGILSSLPLAKRSGLICVRRSVLPVTKR